MKIKVCLLNPSTIDESKNASPLSTRNKYFLNPNNIAHIGLGYIAAVLKQAKYECDVIELSVDDISINEAITLMLKRQYTIVGISVYYYNFLNTIRIVKKLRKENPNIFIWLGGLLPTLCIDDLMKLDLPVDCYMIGEGECTTFELVKALEDDKEWSHITGLAFKKADICVKNPKRKLIDSLDVLPFPYRKSVENRKIAAIVTSRGCYGNCIYCGIREYVNTCNGHAYRRRTPQNVVNEIDLLVKKEQVEIIVFNDGVFHIASKEGRKWFDEFEKLIIRKGICVKYLCDFRANEIIEAEDIVRRFKNLGLYNVNIGVESFVQKQLDFYNKNITVEQNIQAIKIIEGMNINYTIGILLFDPISSLEEVLEFCRTSIKMDYYKEIYSINRPFSIGSRVIATTGTALYDYVIKHNLYADNEYNYCFKDNRLEEVYNVITKWSNEVSEIFNLNYISYISAENGFETVDIEIRNLYKQLFLLDREFIMETCRIKKKNGNLLSDEWSKYLQICREKLDVIRDRLISLESQLLEFY